MNRLIRYKTTLLLIDKAGNPPWYRLVVSAVCERVLPFAVALMVLSLSSVSKAIPPDTRDYVSSYFSPSNALIVYGYARHVSSADKTSFSQAYGSLRASYLLKFSKLFASASVALPIFDTTSYRPVYTTGSMTPSGTEVKTEVSRVLHASGAGDLRLFPTVGYNIEEDAKTATHTTIAFTAYLTLATGAYDGAKLLNSGENRFVFEPQLILGQRFLRIVTIEAFGSVNLYRSNKNYPVPVPAADGTLTITAQTLDQEPTFTAGALLAVDLSKEIYLGLSYFLEAVGKKSYTLASTNAKTLVSSNGTLHTLRLTTGISLRPTTTLLVQYNEDIAASQPINLGRFIGFRISQLVAL